MKHLALTALLLLAMPTEAHNYHDDYMYMNRATLAEHYQRIEDLKICRKEDIKVAYHKQLGKLEISKVVGNRVYTTDYKWYYLDAFKDCYGNQH